MKATLFHLPPKQRHPAIQPYQEAAFKKLLACECKSVDGDLIEDGESFFKNNKRTLVVALPDLADSCRKENEQIHEWVEDYLDDFSTAVAELKADEFEIQPLEGMEGYSRIARFWWD
jgi:hypothetical protein